MRLSALTDPVHDIRLGFCKCRGIRTHVVKQDGQFINPYAVKHLQFRDKRGAGSIVKAVKNFERAKPDTKTQALLAAKSTKFCQFRNHRRRVRLLPAPAQKGISFGRI